MKLWKLYVFTYLVVNSPMVNTSSLREQGIEALIKTGISSALLVFILYLVYQMIFGKK